MEKNEKENMEELKNAAEKWRDQMKRQNDFAKNNYDRMGIVVNKGVKDIIVKEYQKKGYEKFNQYALDLISKDLQIDVSQKADKVMEALKRKEQNQDPEEQFFFSELEGDEPPFA